MAETTYFTAETFAFLRDLKQNNNRDWFKANRDRYEEHLKEPAQRFIMDFAEPLEEISPAFVADPRPVGGSLFRIHRDTRFSRDKSPYKTAIGIQFRHHTAKDAHAPGFYLHIAPGEVFSAMGIWHPDTATLRRIRDALVESPPSWRRAIDDSAFRAHYDLAGESLVRAPRGYDPEHPLIDDLKRKDFIAVTQIDEEAVMRPDFLPAYAELAQAGKPLVSWLDRKSVV